MPRVTLLPVYRVWTDRDGFCQFRTKRAATTFVRSVVGYSELTVVRVTRAEYRKLTFAA